MVVLSSYQHTHTFLEMDRRHHFHGESVAFLQNKVLSAL